MEQKLGKISCEIEVVVLPICFSYNYAVEYNLTITTESPTKLPRNPYLVLDKQLKVSDWDLTRNGNKKFAYDVTRWKFHP